MEKRIARDKEDSVIKIRLSEDNLCKLGAVCAIEHVDCSKLLEQLIEDGLRKRIIHLYEKGKFSAGRGAEILRISLREFLQLLESNNVALNWDLETVEDYVNKQVKTP